VNEDAGLVIVIVSVPSDVGTLVED
jgi:hypothetical protein